jgi:hypothetical protein
MMETPKDKANEPARVINLDEYRRKKFAEDVMPALDPMHPSVRAKKKREEDKDE